MNEDELVEALGWALSSTKPTGITGLVEYWVNLALLDAARLIREHEWPGYYGYCAECASTEPEGHAPKCKVGMWVRAAMRAGL